MIVLAAVSWGFANVYLKMKFADADKIQVTTFQMLFGSLALALAALAGEWGEPVLLDVNAVFALVFSGVFASALCFTLWFSLLAKIDTYTATISVLLVPVFGTLFSALVLDESLGIEMLCGMVFILLGILLTQLQAPGNKRRGREPFPAEDRREGNADDTQVHT
ncbi:hypothetical protein BSNK01_07290 [Bacillaceae bacterium]